jgi:hypothetical protein
MFKITINGKAHYYATLDAAKAVASEIFDKTGIVVAIVAA